MRPSATSAARSHESLSNSPGSAGWLTGCAAGGLRYDADAVAMFSSDLAGYGAKTVSKCGAESSPRRFLFSDSLAVAFDFGSFLFPPRLDLFFAQVQRRNRSAYSLHPLLELTVTPHVLWL